MLKLTCSCGNEIENPTDKAVFGCPGKDSGPKTGWWHVIKAHTSLPCGSGNNDILQRIISERRNRCGERNPYKLFAELLAPYQIDAGAYIKAADEINSALARKNGTGFRETPVSYNRELSNTLGFSQAGGVWLKDETENITGSHKARHAMGTALYLRTLEKNGQANEKNETNEKAKKQPRLSIYSCGNAALGASAVAAAAEYPISVFVPESVDPAILKLLVDYNAEINMCVSAEFLQAANGSVEQAPQALETWPILGVIKELRERFKTGFPVVFHENPKERHGDPTYLKFRESLENGALPISCSGPDNWSAIEGGKTLGFEFTTQVLDQYKNTELDTLVIQVGGGALASSAIQAYETLRDAGIALTPKIHVVQTAGGFPLVRAYYLFLKEFADKNGLVCSLAYKPGQDDKQSAAAIYDYCRSESRSEEIEGLANFISDNFDRPQVRKLLREMVENPEKFMRPWHEEPKSKAHGILDDVTYDWIEIMRGLLRTGGRAVIATEEELEKANDLIKKKTSIRADHTGTSGLAGLIFLRNFNIVKPYEKTGVLITGKERH